MIATLATLPVHPESVPIKMLVRAAVTPLADAAPLDPIEFACTIVVARIAMPRSMVRLSGRSCNRSPPLPHYRNDASSRASRLL